MRRKMLCVLWIIMVTLMLATPAYARAKTENGGNGGLGGGMGTGNYGTQDGISAKSYDTGMNVKSIDDRTRTKTTAGHEVSIYGTGTGSQFLNVNKNANTPGTMNRSGTYHTESNVDGGYRATAVDTDSDTAWGWLGLLGLLGLFGLRNRNPQRND